MGNTSTTPNDVFKDEQGQNIIHIACSLGLPIEEIQKLTDSHPSHLPDKTFQGWTPLHIACSRQNPSLSVIRHLIDQYPHALKMKDSLGFTPLHNACHNQNEKSKEIIQTLLQKCPESISERNNFGWLPLQIALKQRSTTVDIINYLADCGDPSYLIEELPHHGWSILHLACSQPFTSSSSSSSSSSCSSAVEIVQFCASRYPKAASLSNSDGQLPLHLACRNGAPIEIINLLLELHPHGASRVSKEKNEFGVMEGGGLPLHHVLFAQQKQEGAASSPDVLEVIRTLIRHYPQALKVKIRYCSMLPLHQALEVNVSIEIVRLLIEHYPKSVSERFNARLPMEMAKNQDVKNMLLDVYTLFHHRDVVITKEDAFRIMNNFVEDGWIGGVWMVLRSYPKSIRRLMTMNDGEFDERLIPFLMCVSGQRCGVGAVMEVLLTVPHVLTGSS